MKKIISISILMCILLMGCSTERIIYQNNTIERTIEVIKECPVIPDCICNCQEPQDCKKTICDTSLLDKCYRDKAVATAQVDYYKDLSIRYVMSGNITVEDLQENLSNCISDKEEMRIKLDEIKQSIEG